MCKMVNLSNNNIDSILGLYQASLDTVRFNMNLPRKIKIMICKRFGETICRIKGIEPHTNKKMNKFRPLARLAFLLYCEDNVCLDNLPQLMQNFMYDYYVHLDYELRVALSDAQLYNRFLDWYNGIIMDTIVNPIKVNGHN